jgi:hypothetical protein
MFIDFFEIAFIVIPLLAPVAEKILPGLVPGMTPDAAMIWFGVIIAMNLQTSFLTPPFGFALFYLRSVAAKKDYKDRVTGQNIRAVTTNEIYKGSIAFIILQLIMVAAIMIYPSMVTGGIVKEEGLSNSEVMELLRMPEPEAMPAPEVPGAEPAPATEETDPLKAMQESMEKGAKPAQ